METKTAGLVWCGGDEAARVDTERERQWGGVGRWKGTSRVSKGQGVALEEGRRPASTGRQKKTFQWNGPRGRVDKREHVDLSSVRLGRLVGSVSCSWFPRLVPRTVGESTAEWPFMADEQGLPPLKAVGPVREM